MQRKARIFLLKLLSILVPFCIAFSFNGCGNFEPSHDIGGESLSHSSSISGESAEKILKSYEETIFPIVRGNGCLNCHGSNQSPYFAVSNPRESMEAMNSLIKPHLPEKSRIVTRLSEDLHNCWGNCQSNASELLSAIKTWLTEVEKIINEENLNRSEGHLAVDGAIETQRIPSDIPTEGAGYKTMSFKLDGLGQSFKGALFQIEISLYASNSYQLKNPRFFGLTKKLRVEDLQFQMNGQTVLTASTFRVISFDSIGNSILSESTLLIDKESGQGIDMLTPSFALLETTTEPADPTQGVMDEDSEGAFLETNLALSSSNRRESVTMNLGSKNISAIVMSVFDPDNKGEGQLFINGMGPISLFDMADSDFDNETVNVRIDLTDSQKDYFVKGRNLIEFVHVKTNGYRVRSIALEP